MKNFKQYIAALSLLALVSCDPMHDVYVELDKKKLPLNASFEYELTAKDYDNISKEALALAKTPQDSALAKSIKSQLAFNNTYKPAMFVPSLLKKLYPHLGFTSKAMVTYNVAEDIPQNILKLQNLTTQVLTLADYQVVMGAKSDMNFFTPLYPADLNLPKVMETKFASITKDSVVHVQYNYITSDPVKKETSVSLMSKNFEDGTDKSDVIPGWENIARQGTKKWNNRSYSGNMYGDISAFGTTGPVETWLVSPDVAIAAGTDPKLGFDVKIRYFKHAGLKVKISSNYTTDVTTATWDDVTSLMGIPEKDQDPFIACTKVSLAKYAGKTINVAFLYEGDGTADKTTTYQIDNITISEVKSAYINPVYVKDVMMERYNGKWSQYKYGTVLSPSDYEKMGAKNSFKDQAFANSVLPTYMKEVFPYVVNDGDTRTILYKVGSSEKVSEYIMTNGAFVLNNFIVSKTEQYVHNEKEWIFDPSIKFDLANADFVRIFTWVKENKPAYIDAKYPETTEWYFGANSKFNNFEHTQSRLEAADKLGNNEFEGKEVADVMKERMIKCLTDFVLTVNYPEATPLDGIETFYIPKFVIRNGTVNAPYTMKFKLIEKGKFEYVSGPDEVK